MITLLLFSGLSLADGCPDVSVVEASTPYDASRVWKHEPGWFKPLDDPKGVPLAGEGYGDDAMIYVQAGDAVRAWPVAAMAYHHVANDQLGGEPIVVTY